MRIGLPAIGSSIDQLVRQAERAEGDGFTSIWYTGGAGGDSLASMAVVGRATTTIELGTAILPTYGCHPVLMASRAASVPPAIGAAGRFTLGIGPSHQPFIEGPLGLSYDAPGAHTEEYVQVLAPLLRGEAVRFQGEQFRAETGSPGLLDGVEIPLLVAALGSRLLRVAGTYTAGSIPWMANAVAIEQRIAPRINKAAADAGRPAPRIVAGLPVAVHHDEAEARGAVKAQFGMYGQLPNYQRIFDRGGVPGPAEAAIVGDEASVTAQITALFEAGATDVWLAVVPVGADAAASRTRSRTLLRELAAA